MPSSPKDRVADESGKSIEEIEKSIEAWVTSQEGTKQLLAARDSARSAVEKVTADAQVEPEQLRRAVTL